MYILTDKGLGQALQQQGLAQCDTRSANIMTNQDIINTIKCELQRKFPSLDDSRLSEQQKQRVMTRLLARKQRLIELFNGLPPSDAKNLFDQLQQSSDPLAKLFRSRLAKLTRKDLLSILFFAEYDLRFEPVSTTSGVLANPRMTAPDKSQRIKDVQDVVSELISRRDARAAAALLNTIPPSAAAPPVLLPAVQRLSIAQLALFREFFPDSTGGIDFSDFQRGFELFNNGEFHDPMTPGKREPNGGFEFLFAEFAFLCIDSGIDITNWTKLLRIFVQTQEIFIHVYRPAPHSRPPRISAPLPPMCSGNRPLDGPGGFEDTNFNAVGQSNDARKKALRVKYARMDLAKLRSAARDNLLQAQCMP